MANLDAAQTEQQPAEDNNTSTEVPSDPEILTQLILLAASHHNVPTLRQLLRSHPDGSRVASSAQDGETGYTPLHAAIAAAETLDADSDHCNGEHESSIAAAQSTVKVLLENGAIWNDTDGNNETPGCMALRLGLKDLYEVMVDAGVRAEMLLSRLHEYERLEEGHDSGEDVDGDRLEVDGPKEVSGESERGVNGSEIESGATNGETNELEAPKETGEDETAQSNEEYLQAALRFQDGRIVDAEGNGVMMAWEADIMKRSAQAIATTSGLRILNIGHGMGIIDAYFQETQPRAHHIIEAHPAVLQRMERDGWHAKSNVTIHRGKWQDVVPALLGKGDLLFDAIYFDTFAEDYSAFRDFFSDFVLGLLDDQGRWSFFNGIGADRQICYDVYTKIVEMDLLEAGFDTEWETITVPLPNGEEWKGLKRKYWALSEYRLPICKFMA